MKKLSLIFIILLTAALIFASCSLGGNASVEEPDLMAETASDNEATLNEDNFSSSYEATGDFTITPGKGAGEVTVSGSTYTITSAGEYTLSGKLEGNIVVDAGEEDEVVLILSNATIISSESAPIAFLSADSGTVKSDKDTYNAVYDEREGDPETTAEDDDDYDGAIYAECDLKLSGHGSLIVESSYDNGVKTKDDLKVKNVTLKVTAPGNALKGNDTVTISSGSLILTSTASDGIKTKNSDVSAKGNQRGTVTIEGGTVDIYAACDGISAAYDAVIFEGDENCVVNIYTASYSEGAEASSELYIIVGEDIYDEASDYYAYFYNDDDTGGKWVKAEYETMVYNGMYAAYYGLLVRAPSGYENFLVNTVPSGTSPDGENYTSSSGGETLNASMNGYLIESVSGGAISGDWVTLSSGDGSSNKTTFSSKGIKAANAISIKGGTVTINSMDDGVHANGGDELENGSTGAGNITVSGGSVTIRSADDGFHADGELTISNGYVNVAESHEGLEANVVTIAGGEVFVCGDDDGINACRGASAPLVNITGGYLDVTTPSGDTDAVDSNGNFTMSGGFALIKGGASSGGMAGSVDVDGTVSVTGGTIIALGGICEVPESGSVNYYTSNGTNFSAGEYVLKSSDGARIATFSLSSDYSSCWIASDALALDGTYVLTKDGSTLFEWAQSSSAAGDSVMGGFGGMGPGGRR